VSTPGSAHASWHWYWNRLTAMGPREIGGRLLDRLRERRWRRLYFARDRKPNVQIGDADFRGGLSRPEADDAPEPARTKLIECANRLLEGRWHTFEIERTDLLHDTDWHWDARHGTQVPPQAYAFDIRLRATQFDPKYVWELSRHHQTTVLAMAFRLTGEERYAIAAAAQIESWIAANPFLHGINWSSGIEIGMRLIAFVWTRRLLESWPHVRDHFEQNVRFVETVFLHQWVLARRHSDGSSANNHLLYEMAGLLIAASAMPWFAHSPTWQSKARRILEREFPKQVFPSGYSRELASEYDGFVLETLMLCLVEASLTTKPFDAAMWGIARRMGACLDEISDGHGHPPRQGDSDDASGLLLDAQPYDRWADLADITTTWFGSATQAPASLRAWLLAPLAKPDNASKVERPSVAKDAGLIILRARRGTPEEIYCAFDAGPHGYLSIAAHAHADALAIELRYGGKPVLVDPGTYLYAGPWRDYFRSTAAHNTVELGGVDQSTGGGPFLWTTQARATILERNGFNEDARRAMAEAEHDGYARTPFGGHHRRRVSLDRGTQEVVIRDAVSVAHAARCRVHYHLHPDIACELNDGCATLLCGDATIHLDLPPALAWSAVRGREAPGLGWYSPAYGIKVPTTTLVGEIDLSGSAVFETRLRFPQI
jgi:hypothetical protein